MKKIILIILSLFSIYVPADEVKDTKISDITVEQLTDIVRQIVQETIEKCVVTGDMVGRAKLNLAVEGEVVAQMVCKFEEAEQ
tara:strand:+ start:2923 stop:3171 length:249 start_codon:yes stop_codon:yes gene_type:complete